MDMLAEFTRALFLAEVEAQQQDPTGVGAAWAQCRELEAEAEWAYRRKLAEWEADEPLRQQAERASERAMRQRAGAAVPVRVAACLDWTRPRPPGHLAARA